MVKSEQALILDPPTELHFQAPFTEVVTSYLKLTNPTDQRICFKIRTTAPKTYCVRPNYGIVLPKKTLTVSLMLQPLGFETTEKGKHKFMVQSFFAQSDEEDSEVLWNETPADKLMNSKLVCVFDPPKETTVDGGGDKSISTTEPVPKASEDVAPISKPAQAELLKDASQQKQQLAAQILQLRQENSSLKEESLRLRLSRPAPEEPAPVPAAHPKPALRPPVQGKKQLSTTYLYLAIIIVFSAGVYLGRTFI